MSRYRTCPICGSEDSHNIEQIRLWLPKEYHLPEEYYITSCSVCGFCYADTSATAKDYDNYYANCNSYSGTPVAPDEWSWLHETVGRLVFPYISKMQYQLDMGFGKGNFLRWMRTHGYSNIIGIDPSPESVDMVKAEGFTAILGSIFDSPAEDYRHHFQCVFLFDVLEHLLYPKEAIKNLIQYIIPEGYIALSVPNYACLKKNYHPITNMFNQEHINYFSELSLDNLMSECGLVRITTNVGCKGKDEEIVALYQVSDKHDVLIKMDLECEKEICEYTQHFRDKKREIEYQLGRLRENGIEDVYVWGTGAFTMWLLANTNLIDFQIQFIDNNPTKMGKQFGNSLIFGPDKITQSGRVIIICSMLYAKEIEKQIREMGIENDIIIL